MADASQRGRLVWFELMTTDLSAAERFYTTVVGWTITAFHGSPTGPYSMFTRPDGVPVAGGMALPPDLVSRHVPPNWMLYVGVASLDAVTADAVRLGGQALSPVIDVPTVGRMMTLADPQGAAFNVLEPAPSSQGQPEAPARLGDVSWVELMTTDAAAAMRYYTELFGWTTLEPMDMGPMGTYHMFGRPLGPLGGMMNKTPEMAQIPPYWGLYFRVDDIDAAKARVIDNGGQVVNGPMEVPGGDWIVNCLDPQGAGFSLHAAKA